MLMLKSKNSINIHIEPKYIKMFTCLSISMISQNQIAFIHVTKWYQLHAIKRKYIVGGQNLNGKDVNVNDTISLLNLSVLALFAFKLPFGSKFIPFYVSEMDKRK